MQLSQDEQFKKVMDFESRPLSFSSMKSFITSPAKFWFYRLGLLKWGKHDDFSKHFHALLLEGVKPIIFDPSERPEQSKGMTSKLNKEWKLSLGDDLMSLEDFEEMQEIRTRMMSTGFKNWIEDDSILKEPTKFHDFDGYKTYIKPDMVKPNDFVLDVKHMGDDLSDGAIRRFIEKNKTYMQLAIYAKGYNCDSAYVLAYSKKPPYNFVLHQVDDYYLELGMIEFNHYIAKMKDTTKEQFLSSKLTGDIIYPSSYLVNRIEELNN